MIVVLDSNVFLSALLTPAGNSGLIYAAWRKDAFQLATCEQQLDEIRQASRNPKFSHILQPHEVGIMMNNLRRVRVLTRFPRRHIAFDPTDAFLLDLSAAARAHFLVTGDKRSGLLQERKVENTRIVTPAEFCTLVLSSKR